MENESQNLEQNRGNEKDPGITLDDTITLLVVEMKGKGGKFFIKSKGWN